MPERQFTCKRCDKTFYRKSRHAVYCSRACQGTPRLRNRNTDLPETRRARYTARKVIAMRVAEEGRCERCGSADQLHGHHKKSFATHPELRTDPANIEVLCWVCHADEHPGMEKLIQTPRLKRGTYIICPTCGKARYVTDWDVKRGATYCNATCMTKGRKGKTREKNNIIKCVVCAKEVLSYTPNGRFCGETCRQRDFRDRHRISITCAICSGPGITSASLIKQGHGKFCSRACATQYTTLLNRARRSAGG